MRATSHLMLVIIVLIAMSGGVAAETAKLQPDLPVLLLDCKVNGRPEGRFLLSPSQFDKTMVAPELVSRLGLQDLGGRATISLEVAGVEFTGLSVVIDRNGNYSHPALKPFVGILGYDVASKFKITLDYRNRRASVVKSRPGDVPEESERRAVIKLDTSRSVPVISLKARGKELSALVDICATRSTVSPSAAEKVGRDGAMCELEIGADGHKLGAASFIVTVNPRCEQIAAERGVSIDAVLGLDFLSNYVVTLDLSNGVLVLDTPDSRPVENGEKAAGRGHKSDALGVMFEFDEKTRTAKITRVLPDSPLKPEKVEAGDVIVKVNGVSPKSAEHLTILLKPGAAVVLEMKKGEWSKTVKVTLLDVENGQDVPAPDTRDKNMEEVKELLRKSGFSEEQIKTLLELFELRVKAPAPDTSRKPAMERMKKAGLSQAQAEALLKLFKMKKGKEPEPTPDASPLEQAVRNARQRGVAREQIDKVIQVGKVLKWSDEKVIEQINRLLPKEAPQEEG